MFVVVGGGTAGLEAACTAAEVGCNVFVLERRIISEVSPHLFQTSRARLV